MIDPRRAALVARADFAEVVERINAGVVPVRPVNADRVATHRFHFIHAQLGLVHRKRVIGRRRVAGLLRLGSVRAGAACAGAFVAQILDRILAMMAILPVDFDALRLGDRDVFGFGGG